MARIVKDYKTASLNELRTYMKTGVTWALEIAVYAKENGGLMKPGAQEAYLAERVPLEGTVGDDAFQAGDDAFQAGMTHTDQPTLDFKVLEHELFDDNYLTPFQEVEQFPELAKAINDHKSFYEAIYFPIKYVLSSEKHLVERYGKPDAPSMEDLEVWSACMTPCTFDPVSVPDGLKDVFFLRPDFVLKSMTLSKRV